MKRRIQLPAFLICMGSLTMAQNLEIIPYISYQWAGFGVGIGTGGVGAGFNMGSYIFQGDIGGGLVFNLGPMSKPRNE